MSPGLRSVDLQSLMTHPPLVVRPRPGSARCRVAPCAAARLLRARTIPPRPDSIARRRRIAAVSAAGGRRLARIVSPLLDHVRIRPPAAYISRDEWTRGYLHSTCPTVVCLRSSALVGAMSLLFCLGVSVSHPPTASFLYSVCLYGVSLASCCVNEMTRCAI